MKLSFNGKIKYKELLFILLVIPFFPLQSITMLEQYNAVWGTIYNVLAVVRCAIAVWAVCNFCYRLRTPSTLTKGIFLLEVSIFVACCFNGSITFQFLVTNCLSCFGFACMCQEADKKNERLFLKAITDLFCFFALMGAFSVLIFPNGFNHSAQKQFAIYLLGSKNSMFFYYMLFLFLKIIQSKYNGKEITAGTIMLTLLFMLTTLICDSMNGFLMLTLILLFLIFSKYKITIRQIVNPKTALIIVIVFAVFIPLIAEGKMDWFFNMLGRESNFSMRTYIWDSAIEMIKKSPIFGNGKDGDLIFYGGQTHAHDVYLDYASKYGLITLASFAAVVVAVGKKVSKCKNKEMIYICAAFEFILLFHSLFDVVSMPLLILFFLYCIKIAEPSFIEKLQERKLYDKNYVKKTNKMLLHTKG